MPLCSAAPFSLMLFSSLSGSSGWQGHCGSLLTERVEMVLAAERVENADEKRYVARLSTFLILKKRSDAKLE